MTFRQAKELGAHVRKGEKGSLVVYADHITRTETDTATGKEFEAHIPFLKGYTVFNVKQIEGLPRHYYTLAAPVLDPVQRIEHAEAFFAQTGAQIRHGGNQAYYAIGSDHVQMPPFERTFAWISRNRRLARDFERHVRSVVAFIRLAMIRIMLRRLAANHST